ncbi:hypothetical protein JG687_00012314 [Phytophthora cactorum]|uniref:RxLR effector PexRD54 WY domain-containing protein n=1 Tax=Phytophthora cactorum TaxID=29920 RepID=A0A8T1U4N8_9STRA|nr:hypothetical protein JG687_00012314 [Phytophthora cactorum]
MATAALFASLDATSTTVEAQMTQLSGPASERLFQSFSSNQRSLRVHNTADNDEERAFTLPGAGKLADVVESWASKIVQSAKIQSWLLAGRKTDDIFTTLQLNKAGNKIFEDPKFITWVVYVAKVEKHNPEEVILSKLMTQYTPESLATMIAAAKKVSNAEGLATLLQAQQRRVWMNAGESGDDVFKLLRLDDTGTKLFETPQFTTWTSYVDDFNRNNHNEAVSSISLLAKRYNEATLSEMLEAAKKVSSTESIATKLQTQQNELWLSQKKSPDDVFKLLKLNEPDLAVLIDPKLSAWSSYLKEFNLANPGKETTLLATLTSHYTDLGVAQLLQEGKKFTLTKEVSEDLQNAQFARWFYEKKTQDDIFNLLNLKRDTWLTDSDTMILREYNRFYKKVNTPN